MTGPCRALLAYSEICVFLIYPQLIRFPNSLSIKANLRARRRKRRILNATLIVAIIGIIVVAYLIAASFSSQYTSYIGKPLSSSLYQELATFNSTYLSAVGAGSGALPSTISGSSLTSNGKPEVLYVGGEYCPFCGVTRWSMIIALSKFGNFTGLEYMLSSGSDVNANTPTFTFANASFTSPYISLVTVEHWDRSDNIYQPLTTDEQSLISQYDTSGSIPFIDFANQYTIVGAVGGLGAIDLSGMNWTQVATQLRSPGSSTAQAIIGEANYFISAICAIDSREPSSVCSQSNGTLTLAYPSPASSVSTPITFAIQTSRLDLPWIA